MAEQAVADHRDVEEEDRPSGLLRPGREVAMRGPLDEPRRRGPRSVLVFGLAGEEGEGVAGDLRVRCGERPVLAVPPPAEGAAGVLGATPPEPPEHRVGCGRPARLVHAMAGGFISSW